MGGMRNTLRHPMEQHVDSKHVSFAQSRCFNHAQREAAARCPECGRFFCRECVSEHRNRLLCAACIAEETAKAQLDQKRNFGSLRMVFRIALGVLVLWGSFFVIGKALLSVPSTFHEHKTILEDDWDSS